MGVTGTTCISGKCLDLSTLPPPLSNHHHLPPAPHIWLLVLLCCTSSWMCSCINNILYMYAQCRQRLAYVCMYICRYVLAVSVRGQTHTLTTTCCTNNHWQDKSTWKILSIYLSIYSRDKQPTSNVNKWKQTNKNVYIKAKDSI